jgi:hypothetical protein
MLWRRRGDYVSNGDIEMVSERPKGLTREAIEVYPVSVYGISNCTFTTPTFIPIDSQKDSTSISIDAPSLPLSLPSPLTLDSKIPTLDQNRMEEEPEVCIICIEGLLSVCFNIRLYQWSL